jgi:hypothetical protein
VFGVESICFGHKEPFELKASSNLKVISIPLFIGLFYMICL